MPILHSACHGGLLLIRECAKRFNQHTRKRQRQCVSRPRMQGTCRMAASNAGSAGWPTKRTMPWRSTTSAQGMPVTPAAIISSWPTLASRSATTCGACGTGFWFKP